MKSDWLIGEDQDPVATEAERVKALNFAKLYEVFVQDPRGKALLAHWDKTLRRRRVPVNATIQEYAAIEAARDFVQKIQEQIEFATTEGRFPQ